MKRNASLLGVASVLALGVAGCEVRPVDLGDEAPVGAPQVVAPEVRRELAETARVVRIEIVDGKFVPDEIVARPNEPIQLWVTNRGTVEHDIEFVLPRGNARNTDDIDPGESGRIIFMTPQESGTYPFHDPLQPTDMRGTLIVR